MDFSRDELRRELREIDRMHRASESAQRSLLTGVFEDLPAEQRSAVLLSGVDRRGFFRIGGLAVAATAVLAACREKEPKEPIPVSGESPGFEPAKIKPVTDIVLLRTASSFEWSIVDAYQKLLNNGFIEDPAVIELVLIFQSHHISHADSFAQATTAAGGTACTQLNSKITGDLLDPILATISGAGGNRAEDSNAFAHALETLAGATYQSFTPSFSQPALRKAAMAVGAVEARHASVLAALLNPTVLVSAATGGATAPLDTAPTTTAVFVGVPTSAPAVTTTLVESAAEANIIYAIPGVFGSLAPIPLTVGASAEGVTRKSVNLETPSLNSYLYEDEAC